LIIQEEEQKEKRKKHTPEAMYKPKTWRPKSESKENLDKWGEGRDEIM